MNKKQLKIYITALIMLSLMGTTNIAFAEGQSALEQPAAPSVSVSVPVTSEVVPNALKNEKQLKKLKNQGARMISERINSLNRLSKLVKKSKLTEAQKNSLLISINDQVASLTDLGVKIKADTAIETARNDVKSIYENYRIYSIFIPKIKLTISLYNQQNHIEKLNGYFSKVQEKINQAKAKGKDTAARQKSLDDSKAMIPTISAKINQTLAAVTALKPGDYPTTSKKVINDANKSLREIHSLFVRLGKTLRGAR